MNKKYFLETIHVCRYNLIIKMTPMYSYLLRNDFMAPKVSEEYKRERKKDLIKFAGKVFTEKGFVHTSMQDIMDEANVSRGTLYSYFGNIEHVFLEVLKYEDQKDIEYFKATNGDNMWKQLISWIEEQRLYIQKIDQTLLRARAEFFLSSNYANDKNNYPYISKRYNQLIRLIKEMLDKGKVKDEFRPQQSTEAIAKYLVSFINGLMLDTFQLGYEQTGVEEQFAILFFTLEKLISPITLNKE